MKDIQRIIDRQRARFLKPHFTKIATGWQCEAMGARGTGQTVQGAYWDWQSRTRPAQSQWMPSQIHWTPQRHPFEWPRNDAAWHTPPFFNVTCGVQ